MNKYIGLNIKDMTMIFVYLILMKKWYNFTQIHEKTNGEKNE